MGAVIGKKERIGRGKKVLNFGWSGAGGLRVWDVQKRLIN